VSGKHDFYPLCTGHIATQTAHSCSIRLHLTAIRPYKAADTRRRRTDPQNYSRLTQIQIQVLRAWTGGPLRQCTTTKVSSTDHRPISCVLRTCLLSEGSTLRKDRGITDSMASHESDDRVNL
jgi:hypothetical protein